MRNLAVRLALAAVFAVACAAAAYLLWNNQARLRIVTSTFRTFDAAALAAERDTLELRAAQQAYVAAGQGEAFWIQKVSGATAALRDRIAAVRASAAIPEAQSALDSAASALQDFDAIDRRARDYARNGQRLLASDLIFADGIEITGALASSIEQARTIERGAYDAERAAVRRVELAATGGAAALGLAVLLLLVPAPRPLETARAVIVEAAPAIAAPASSDSGAALDRAFERDTAASGTAPAAAVDFSALAALCGALARVVDTRALPAILERAAAVLEAPGIVLWIADPDGRELSPIVTHGYSQTMVARLGTIRSDAENATAAALRTGLMQTVHADPVSNGAIAAPLVTPVGCVGVMAAEVRNDGEKDSAKLAAAAIVAAQLATLVGPPSTRAQAKTEAV